MQAILYDPPPIPPDTDVDRALVDVILKLNNKAPDERFPDAATALVALCEATNRRLPPETIEIRESYLQAARFVGRQRELSQLTAAVDTLADQADKGSPGSPWLVGGESGVGKSRLLDELRIRAMVKGAAVLWGEAVAEGALPYHMWRVPLRRLILSTDLSQTEAGILKTLLPDMFGDDVIAPEGASTTSFWTQSAGCSSARHVPSC